MSQWDSVAEFINMGGYAVYVWGSYGVTLAVMVADAWLSKQRARRALAQVCEGASS